jgi:hypothetical protein
MRIILIMLPSPEATMVQLAPNVQTKRGLLVIAPDGENCWREKVLRVLEPLRVDCLVEVAFTAGCSRVIGLALARLHERGASRVSLVRMFVHDRPGICAGVAARCTLSDLEACTPCRAFGRGFTLMPVACLGE